jgi:predicted ArsR family transcriptional regulator
MPEEDLTDVLREVGHRMPTDGVTATADLRTRVGQAVALLSGIGGHAMVEEREDGGFLIRGCTCPLAAAVEATPDACCLAESLLTDAIGVPVHQVCDQGPPPRCAFEVPAEA